MHRIMLGRGDSLKIFRIVALQARNESHAHSGGKKGIFTVGFLSSSPARIAEYVDIGRPEIQTLVDVSPSLADGLVVLGSGFLTDGGCHLVNQWRVKGGRKADGFRKDGRRSRTGDAVQRFAPPVVLGHLQTGKGARLVY